MPRILVTNDDGYFSEGIAALAGALAAVGEVTIVAPASEQSASSHSLTLTRPLRVRQLGERRYNVDGTPTDCVVLALMTILKDNRPDLVVSGINHGANLGDDVTYSGTVAGAMEGVIFGVPSIAVSMTQRDERDFSHAAALAARLAGKVLQEGIPDGTLLNVNVPPGEIRGVRWTQQGIRGAQAHIVEGVDPRGKQYYWIGAQIYAAQVEPNSDYAAIKEGLVSITPLRVELTDQKALEKLRDWMLA
ncbi:MAG: 5'/3'-nucleotidase SurE [Acidobacteria bacterium]|nr:5'/3'-nucleotidase SurE [Acidobacteriota bacterium]MBI3428198.1 5'/3'-nucleotidase SurE [Acidobacteriota bacterium]